MRELEQLPCLLFLDVCSSYNSSSSSRFVLSVLHTDILVLVSLIV